VTPARAAAAIRPAAPPRRPRPPGAGGAHPLAAAFVALALALATGCAGGRTPARPPPRRAPSSLALAVEGRRVARESLAAVLAAQRQLTKVLAVALRASAAVWLASHEGCPEPDDLLGSGHPTAARASPTDAWETPFRITCRGDEPEVRSAGPDGVFSTDDDVVASDLD
jgi:hypothetical protein